ncbi:hypothetical protein F2P45_33905 [Massilia sp. CCM 8733]|uniref:tRNA nuclease CdiA C-terminal domain-containing protein n=2 Tax=Massilia mucilaginosa TaxID=2609282 RepID=A0ABX0P3T9_9BURK|nr:hypothetical protein [Massilia mucilaginosa]
MNRAFARVGLRLHVGPSAFGNALGSSLSDEISDRVTQARVAAAQMQSGFEDAAAQRYAYDLANAIDSSRSDLWAMSAGLGENVGGRLPPSGKQKEIEGEVALINQIVADSREKFASDLDAISESALPASTFRKAPFANSDGSRPLGPISTVGGFDSRGNSLNAAQFNLGRSWFGDVVVGAPINLFANTIELIGNNLNLSLTFPGAIDYVSFMDGYKQPYSTSAGPYAEFGLGLGLGALGSLGRAGSASAVAGRIESVTESVVTNATISRRVTTTNAGAYSQRFGAPLVEGEFGFTPTYTPGTVRFLGESAPSTPVSFGSLVPPNRLARPTWRQSELDLEAMYGSHGYSAQESFLNGARVPHGTLGSTRPDLYKSGEAIDMKNYNLTTASGRSSLVSSVSAQAIHRAANLPLGDIQKIVLDVRGQNVSTVELNRVVGRIQQKTNGILTPGQIHFWR